LSSCFSLTGSSDDSLLVSGHYDGSLKFWSSKSDKPNSVIDLHNDKITYIELIKNENQILTCSKDFSIKSFDLRKMETLYTIGSDNLKNYCESGITVSTDKKYFTVGSTKGEIYIFDVQTGKVFLFT